MSKRVMYTLQERIVGMGVGIFFLVTLFFVFEYRALNRTATELLQLKEEYRSYIMALKRALRERDDVKKNEINSRFACENSATLGQESSGILEGFSSFEAAPEPFLVVNREPMYLREGALAYAKQHDLDTVLAKMFDSQEWQETSIQKETKQSKRRRAKKRRAVALSTVVPTPVFDESIGTVPLERDFLFSWPIERPKFWISSRFGPRKIGKRAWKFHYGLDMAAPRGTPVYAAAAGVVLESYHHSGFGNCIVILHNHKYKTRYAHLHTRYVKAGEEVTRGKVIGTVGATGHVHSSHGNDPSHLHFEVYSYGRRINPLSILV